MVDLDVGQSRFRCDLAVRQEGDRAYRLAIQVDSEAHYANANLLERYLLQPSILKAFGWEVMIVLGKDWLADPRLVMDRVDRVFRNIPEPDIADETGPETEPLQPAEKPATARTPAPPESLVRRFEFIAGGSRKFWEIALAGTRFTVSWGKIGMEGQSQEKTFPDEERARRESEKLIAEKLRKGYEEIATAGE